MGTGAGAGASVPLSEWLWQAGDMRPVVVGLDRG